MTLEDLTAKTGKDMPALADSQPILTPAQIAHNTLLTAREKLELLTRLKAEVTGALENSEDLGISPGDIDQAIDEVKLDVENGIGEETILRGDN